MTTISETTALTLIAAARRVNGDAADKLMSDLQDDRLDRVHTVGVALWCARWLAGRAGLGDNDDPDHAECTLREIRRGVENNPNGDVWVARNRLVMLNILDLVAQTGPDRVPSRDQIEALLYIAGDAAGKLFHELDMPAKGWGDELYPSERVWHGRHDVLLRLAELMHTLAAFDPYPMRLLDVLAGQLINVEMEVTA